MIGVGAVKASGADPLEPAKKSLLITPLNLMAPRADGVWGVWAVSELCRGWLEWREVGSTDIHHAAMTPAGFVPQSEEIFRINLSGLESGKSYEIRAVVKSVTALQRTEESDWKSYRTLNPAAEHSHFIVWNDTHDHGDTIRKLDEVSPVADFFIWNGDTCNDWKTETLLIPTLLHPAGRDITKERPMTLVSGNHDVRGAFGFRVPQIIGMTEERPYSAFRSGPVAVICLHTGEDKPDDHPSFQGRVAFDELRKAQTKWLEEIIHSEGFKDAPYRVVFCHIPLRWKDEPETVDYAGKGFDLYSKRSRDAWHELLVKWKAQIVISGHTHQAHYMPGNEAFPYAQMVSGGPQLESARWIEGNAGVENLKLVVRDLSGTITHQAVFARIV